jgi:hypothetical protein
MAKTNTEKLNKIDEEMLQLANKRKAIVQKQKQEERKARTSRLCRRMGLIESILPETIALTDEQFQTFLEKAVANEYGRNTLARIAAQGGGTTTAKTAETAAQGNTPTAANPAATAQTNGTGGSAGVSNGARVTG